MSRRIVESRDAPGSDASAGGARLATATAPGGGQTAGPASRLSPEDETRVVQAGAWALAHL